MRPEAPPKRALQFLRWFCREDYLEEIEGDLTEIYEKHYKVSQHKAKRKFIWGVLKHFRPEFIRSFALYPKYSFTMLIHNLLITYRNFLRYKSSFFINLAGLSAGLACTMLIYLWVSDELQVNTYNEKDSRLYQVMQNYHEDNGIHTGAGTAGILADALAAEIPEVERATSVVPASWYVNDGLISYNETYLKAKGQFISKDYFNIFSGNFIHGDKNTSLRDKNAIAISEKLAVKMFKSTQDAMGKIISWKQEGTQGNFQIAGIFQDVPVNATDQFDILLNYEIFLDGKPWLREWGSSDPCTYVLLREGADVMKVNEKIRDFIKSKYKTSRNTLFLQRFSDRYLYGRYENGAPAGGRIEYVKMFGTIAIFILIIACVNFMNLSTARASRRFKEIGVKKTSGATRSLLMLQYFEESFLVTLASMMVALLLVLLCLPFFNDVTGKHLALTFTYERILALSGIVLFTTILAGSYPALYLSAVKPVEVLKGKLKTSLSDLFVRKGLVVFQFMTSMVLIVSVLVVYKQIQYVQSKNLGYERDHLLHFELDIKADDNDKIFFEEGGTFQKQAESFLNEVKNTPGILSASNYYHNLTGDHGGLGGVDWKDGDEDDHVSFSNLEVGYDFIETMGIKLAAGRNFSRDFANDKSRIIFNETAIKRMGLKDPVGKVIRLWGKEREIIGVVKDFHFESLYQQLGPCLMQLEPRGYRIMARVDGKSQSETIARLEKLFHAHSPGVPFDYQFVDDDYASLYAAEQKVSVLSVAFAGMAIFISCLGLFGLASFTAERRLKEIGIRKILGANQFGIVTMLSSDYTKMVVVAIVIACPLSYYLTTQWLHNFAYRISLQWWFFMVAAFLALCIAWLTVAAQVLRAARVNPVECLGRD